MQPSSASSSLGSRFILRALVQSLLKLSPRVQWRNPVMFVVYIGSLLTSVLLLLPQAEQSAMPMGFAWAITLWLWFTLLFANFSEALAEGRSQAQAAASAAAAAVPVAAPQPKPPADFFDDDDIVAAFETGC